MKVKIRVWYVSYSHKDGPFFTKQDAINFNSIHGGWGDISEEIVEVETIE